MAFICSHFRIGTIQPKWSMIICYRRDHWQPLHIQNELSEPDKAFGLALVASVKQMPRLPMLEFETISQ